MKMIMMKSLFPIAILFLLATIPHVHGFLLPSKNYRPVVDVVKFTPTCRRSLFQQPTKSSSSVSTIALGESLYPHPSSSSEHKFLNDNKQLQQEENNEIDENTDHTRSDWLFGNANTRQILGLKNPSSSSSVEETKNKTVEKWKIRLQLAKPISWVPLSMIVMAGAAASGNYHWIYNPFEDVASMSNMGGVDSQQQQQLMMLGLIDAWKGFLAILLAGPFSEGFAQTINDWYDQDIDAINSPHRPIPSGTITPKEVLQQLIFLFVGGMIIAIGLDYHNNLVHQMVGTSDAVLTTIDDNGGFPIVTTITLLGYLISYIYSAPPLKLKQNGWLGGLAIAICYISFPWWCGQSIFGSMDWPQDWLIPLAFSMTSIAPSIVNDFHSIEGDLTYGLKSIPILIGVEKSKWIAAIIPDLAQIAIAMYLYLVLHEGMAAMFLLLILLPQLYFQRTLLLFDGDILENDMKYIGLTQPFVLLGLMATALTLGQHQ